MINTSKPIYVVMVQKENGSIMHPMLFENQDDAQAELDVWKGGKNVLDAWIWIAPLHKKQRKAA